MNERIRQLAEQAGLEMCGCGCDMPTRQSAKFAELIVAECAGLCNQAAEESARSFYTVTETKEVGSALVAKGSQVQAEKLSKQIREHFGVEE